MGTADIIGTERQRGPETLPSSEEGLMVLSFCIKCNATLLGYRVNVFDGFCLLNLDDDYLEESQAGV